MTESRPAIIVTVCTSCRAVQGDASDRPGQVLLEALRDAAAGAPNIVVRGTQCLSVCKRVCTVALSGADSYTFLFGDIDPAVDVPDLVELAQACSQAPHGFVPWKDRPAGLRSKIIARLPPPSWSPDDGSSPA